MSTSTNSRSQPDTATATLMFASRLVWLTQSLPAQGRQLWGAYWNYHSRRATVRMLQALEDRTLSDIGLARSEIDAAIFGKSAERLRAPK